MALSSETPQISIEDRILDAAERSVLARGFRKTRLEQIAGEVGLQRPNLYRHFESKDALILGVLLRDMREIHERRRAWIEIEGPVAPLLAESLARGFDLSLQRDTFRICLDEDPHHTATLLMRPEAVEVEREYWLPLLAHGRRRREITDDLTDDQIVRWFLGIQFLLHEHTDLFGGPTEVRTYVTTLAIPGVVR